VNKPAAARRFHDWVATKGCLVCGAPATIHHVTGYADRMGRVSRSHWLVAPLCPAHHQHDYGRFSVERLGHRGFYAKHGVDLYNQALSLAAEWRDKELANGP
jgi:hypothetical protein